MACFQLTGGAAVVFLLKTPEKLNAEAEEARMVVAIASFMVN
jgi:hypothetical protein